MPRPTPPSKRPRRSSEPPRFGLARVLSKLGHCSRARAHPLIRAGLVTVNGRVVRDPEHPVDMARDRVAVAGAGVEATERVYLMLNKPAGLVTTASDERGRDTVFACLAALSLPRVFPVGRLDQASEGLLLFSNDSTWADAITAPATHLDKLYHVQITRLPEPGLLAELEAGRELEGERLAVKRAELLRAGTRTAWLALTLDEGRNRHLRRLLGACGYEVRRLVRVAIGPLELGTLAKGQVRALTAAEVAALTAPRTRGG